MAKDDYDYKDYSSEHKAVIHRETQKLERSRARAESLEANMTKGLTAALKASRSNIAKEATRAHNRVENGALSSTEKAMIEAAQKGTDRIFIDEGTITGLEEQRRFVEGEDENY